MVSDRGERRGAQHAYDVALEYALAEAALVTLPVAALACAPAPLFGLRLAAVAASGLDELGTAWRAAGGERTAGH
jgi:hypothetical protein